MQQLVAGEHIEKRDHYALDPFIDHLLVTGATGFIGGAVLAELIDGPLWRDTLILVRAQTVSEGKERIARSLQRFFRGRPISESIGDHQIILGALEDAGCLLEDERAERISHVIHCAAVTSFADSPKIRATNVDASLAFVGSLTAAAPVRRFINVGTAWCVGLRTDEVVPESAEVPEGEHVVPYTASKLEFERRVRRDFPSLNFVSARPSIVVGHTKLGTQPSGSIYWVFRSAFLMDQFTCSNDDRLDVVPVDWVAAALVRLATTRKLRFKNYHLSSGQRWASGIEQIYEAIAEGIGQTHGRGYRKVGSEELAKAVRTNRSRLGKANPWLLTHALNIYGKFAQSGTVFDNQRTLMEGVPPPPPFYTYAGLCAATAEATSLAAQMEDDFK